MSDALAVRGVVVVVKLLARLDASDTRPRHFLEAPVVKLLARRVEVLTVEVLADAWATHERATRWNANHWCWRCLRAAGKTPVPVPVPLAQR